MTTTAEIVDSKIPLLLGAEALDRVGAVWNFKKKQLVIPVTGKQNIDRTFRLEKECSGHFSFEVEFDSSNEEIDRLDKIRKKRLGTTLITV